MSTIAYPEAYLGITPINKFKLPESRQFSSDTSASPIVKAEELVISDDIDELRKNIGKRLFKQLSYEQKMTILSFSNIVNLGENVDIDLLYKFKNDLEVE